MAPIECKKGWADDLNGQILGQLQAACDALHRLYAGHPVERVKDGLRRDFKRRGRPITDPQLTQFAEAISAGAQDQRRSRGLTG
ncbi:hypothetical protein [Mycobacterium sp. E3198]|uniref:hypothetical protein n=1 Tax=Mycobacterium sp. E3198 TaxID=1834143 RepID=UPI000A4A7A4D|nr:hypothetical protein [Mycobacterium sp. E3198]